MKELTPTSGNRRWQLIRDVLVFQLKLVIDGFRDLVLGPISLGAALIGLISRKRGSENFFYDVLRMGEKSERHINLFGAVRSDESGGLDRAVRKVEDVVLDDHRKGGVTARTRDAVDKVIDKVQGDN